MYWSLLRFNCMQPCPSNQLSLKRQNEEIHTWCPYTISGRSHFRSLRGSFPGKRVVIPVSVYVIRTILLLHVVTGGGSRRFVGNIQRSSYDFIVFLTLPSCFNVLLPFLFHRRDITSSMWSSCFYVYWISFLIGLGLVSCIIFSTLLIITTPPCCTRTDAVPMFWKLNLFI